MINALRIIPFLVPAMLVSPAARSQSCTGCTVTITGPSSGTHIVGSGQKLCITSTGSVTGTVILTGGTVCNEGTFQPASFSFSSGTVDNYATATLGSLSMGGSQTVNNFTGAAFTVNGSISMGGANAVITNDGTVNCNGISKNAGIITNNGTLTSTANVTNAGGTFTNNGSLSATANTLTNSGGTFGNNGDITVNAMTTGGGTFNNNAAGEITVSDDYTNTGLSTTNFGLITVTDNFTNSGFFTAAGGSHLLCNDYTNTGTTQGPGANNGCGVISVAVSSTNSGTIRDYADICDATPPAGPVKIDVNSGTVDGTVTYCTCCVLLTATITGDDEICSGENTQLTVNPAGNSYLWSDGQTTQAVTVSPTTTTTFTVTITFSNNCIRTASKAVTVLTTPQAGIAGNTTIFEGESTELSVLTDAANPTYLWSTGATTVSITVSPLKTQNFSVTVTDENGCSAVATATVAVIFPYAIVQAKPDGGYHQTMEGVLYFQYHEEYDDQDGKLTYEIFDRERNLIAASGTYEELDVIYGDNRYGLDVTCIQNGLPAGFYMLEVFNEKRERFFLRFRHTQQVACNPGGGGSE